mgnify:CR=1 FL=1
MASKKARLSAPLAAPILCARAAAVCPALDAATITAFEAIEIDRAIRTTNAIDPHQAELLDEVPRHTSVVFSAHWAPLDGGPPIGYLCAARDPDGNVVEFSYDQGVYAAVNEVWG